MLSGAKQTVFTGDILGGSNGEEKSSTSSQGEEGGEAEAREEGEKSGEAESSREETRREIAPAQERASQGLAREVGADPSGPFRGWVRSCRRRRWSAGRRGD
jgi:hypothetical protein